MKITFIAAMSANRVIGLKGGLPWHLPHDLKHFKSLTLGKHILMGRKTFEGLKKPLPNRINYVLTKNLNFKSQGVCIVHSKEEALKIKTDELIVIGGEEIYRLFLPDCEQIHLTLVHADIEGDSYFPEFEGFREINRQDFDENETHRYKYSFVTYRRMPPSSTRSV